ncbi:MAG: HD domain-containing protein [Candidatus Odinarchaeia archaeon]
MGESSKLTYVKFIFDSIHGYIGVTDVELNIIDSIIFQRLHHIRHLGIVNLVYPSATQTRFAHSLGTMFIMGKVGERLVELGIIPDYDEVQKLRLAALLHDIGHFPLSHVLEIPIKNLSEKKQGGHDSFSHHLITNSILKDRFNSYNPKEIGAIIKKEYTKNELYSLLISSDLDVDRIDYLLRDAHETGVTYGIIDTDRLIRSIVCDEDQQCLAVEDKGRQALENFLLSRYHMYQTVYYHKTSVCFSMMIERIYEELMKREEVYHFKDLLKLCDDEIYDFNDHYLWNVISNHKNDEDYIGEYITQIRNRTPLKMVKEIQAMSSSGSKTPDYTKLELIELPNQLESIKQNSGLSDEWIFYFKPKPIDILSDTESPKAIHIIKKDNSSIPISRDETSVISLLYEKGYLSARLYTKRGSEESLRIALETCLGL